MGHPTKALLQGGLPPWGYRNPVDKNTTSQAKVRAPRAELSEFR